MATSSGGSSANPDGLLASRRTRWSLVAAVSVLVAVILTVVILVAGASDDGEPSQALQTFGATHDLCVSTEGKRDTFSEGLDVFWNVGPGPVTINDVSWSDNEGLELVEARNHRPG